MVLPLWMFWIMTVLPGVRVNMISTTREQLMDRLFKNTKVMWSSSPELTSIFDLAESGKVWRRDMPDSTYATFRTAEKPENMSGLHSERGQTAVGFDESSGVSEAMREACSGALDDPEAMCLAVGESVSEQRLVLPVPFSGDLVDDWHPVHLARWDLPGWNSELHAQLVRRHGGEDTASYRAYVAGQPPSMGDGSYITASAVQDTFNRSLLDADGQRVVPEETPLVCGLDMAKGGSSEWCASFVAGMDGRLPVVRIQGKHLKPKDRVDWIINLMMTPRPPYGLPCVIYYDATGDNGQIRWELERRGYVGKFVPINFAQRAKASVYANKRAEMWGGLKWWIEQGGMLHQGRAVVEDDCCGVGGHDAERSDGHLPEGGDCEGCGSREAGSVGQPDAGVHSASVVGSRGSGDQRAGG